MRSYVLKIKDSFIADDDLEARRQARAVAEVVRNLLEAQGLKGMVEIHLQRIDYEGILPKAVGLQI